jgi:hypothetical protein
MIPSLSDIPSPSPRALKARKGQRYVPGRLGESACFASPKRKISWEPKNLHYTMIGDLLSSFSMLGTFKLPMREYMLREKYGDVAAIKSGSLDQSY